MLHATYNNAVYRVCHDLTFDLSDMFPHSSHKKALCYDLGNVLDDFQ